MNLLIFPRLQADDSPIDDTVPVSVLIPARNESQVIAGTVRSILAQSYKNLEIIVLDDSSEDGTGTIAQEAGGHDPRLRVIAGKALPQGWMGKSWACQNLREAASGEILVFTDADVRWESDALKAVLAQMQAQHVDMLTVWPTQITKTFAERLTVPLMGMVILGYLPTAMVHNSRWSVFAAANGQMMAWRKQAYDGIGGHRVVANNVLDDVTLARAAKRAGFRIRMVDGNRLIETRMYDSWTSVRNGYAKNILAGYGSVPALILGAVFHWLVFMVPYALLLEPAYRMWALVLIISGLCLRACSAIFTRQRVVDALLMPITVILFTVISAQAIWWHYRGGPRWKGRTLGQA